MEALIIKGIVNIAGIGAGAMCIWIGYRLYLHGVVEKGRASAEGAGFKVTLASYGPGVVFAMFGAFIVIFSLTRGMSMQSRESWVDANGVRREEYSSAAATSAEPVADYAPGQAAESEESQVAPADSQAPRDAAPEPE